MSEKTKICWFIKTLTTLTKCKYNFCWKNYAYMGITLTCLAMQRGFRVLLWGFMNHIWCKVHSYLFKLLINLWSLICIQVFLFVFSNGINCLRKGFFFDVTLIMTCSLYTKSLLMKLNACSRVWFIFFGMFFFS